jgi:hypothetical protein
MGQDEITSERVATGAADWLSTVLSVPLIWPKMTALASVGAIVLGVGLVVAQASRPAVPPAPPLDRARVAEIEAQLRMADSAVRSELAVTLDEACEYKGYLHAVSDPDHAEKNHDPSRVHAH